MLTSLPMRLHSRIITAWPVKKLSPITLPAYMTVWERITALSPITVFISPSSLPAGGRPIIMKSPKVAFLPRITFLYILRNASLPITRPFQHLRHGHRSSRIYQRLREHLLLLAHSHHRLTASSP